MMEMIKKRRILHAILRIKSKEKLYFSPRVLVRHSNISDEEISYFLEKETWSLLEAVYFTLGKKIERPFCYEESDIVNFLVDRIQNSNALKPIKIDSDSVRQFLHKINDKITLEFKSWGDNCYYLVEDYIEWVIKNEFPPPKSIYRHLKLYLPKRHIYDDIDTDNYFDKYSHRNRRGELGKKVERVIRIKACGQALLWKGINIKEIEDHPLMQKLIPGTKYFPGSRTLRQNLKEIISIPHGRPKRNLEIHLSFNPLICVLDHDTNTINLITFKLVCMTIVETLRSLNPEISKEELIQHPLISLYLNKASPILKRMYQRWVTLL